MTLGTVLSIKEKPSTLEYYFVSANPVFKNQFVVVDSGGSKTIGTVVEVSRFNRYFESPEVMRRSQERVLSRLPANEWELEIARVRVYGVLENDVIRRPCQAISPGSSVRVAGVEELNTFMGFDSNGLLLGTMEHHDVPVKINLNRALQKHVAVLAMSGAGKSYSVSVLIEELLDRDKARPAVVVLDVHGEYKGFAQDANYNERTKVYEKVKIPVSSLSVSDYSLFMPGMSEAQKRELGGVITQLRTRQSTGKGPYDLSDVINAVEQEVKGGTAAALKSWLEQLAATGLFDKTGNISVSDLAQPGKLSVINLANETNLYEKQVLGAWVSRNLFWARRDNQVPPFVLLVEEAHNFAGNQSHSISRGIIETIAREGRKFGASLCLVSQRPVRLSTTALSQCNTQLILRVTNPYDLKHIGESSEGIDDATLQSITTLRVGEGILVGEAVNFPLFLKIRERKSKEGSLGKDFEQAALDYEKKDDQKRSDAGAFM